MSALAPAATQPNGTPELEGTGRIARRLLQVAQHLAAGRRETPQRFYPIAGWAASSTGARLGLIRYLLSDALTDAEQGGGCPPDALELLQRLSRAVGLAGPVNVPAIFTMAEDILALAPRRRRRRSIHCHGRVASDRRLLIARAVFDVFDDWDGRYPDYDIWCAVAYTICDYDYDHFLMIGPNVEHRVRRLAHWIEQQPSANGTASAPASPQQNWEKELIALCCQRRRIAEAKTAAAYRAIVAEKPVSSNFGPAVGPSRPEPPPAASDRLAVQLRAVADRLATGTRETPQRFVPVARWAADDVFDRLRLIRYLVNFGPLLEEDPTYGPEGPQLIQRLSRAVGETEIPDGQAVRELGDEILTLAPRGPGLAGTHRQDSIDPDRRLLFARALLDDVYNWRPATTGWHHVWLMVAYAMCDYRHDGFSMYGPTVQRRVWYFSNWLRAAQIRKETDARVGIRGRK